MDRYWQIRFGKKSAFKFGNQFFNISQGNIHDDANGVWITIENYLIDFLINQQIKNFYTQKIKNNLFCITKKGRDWSSFCEFCIFELEIHPVSKNPAFFKFLD